MTDEKNTGQATGQEVAGSGGAGTAEDTAAQTAGGTDLAGGASVGELVKRLEEQRKIQAGLDRRVQQLNAQLAEALEAREALEKQLAEMQGVHQEREVEFAKMQERLVELEAIQAELEDKAQANEMAARRAEIIATEFPALAPLLEAGIVPDFDGNEDVFRTKLNSILETMSKMASVNAQVLNQGARPPAAPPAGGSPADPQKIFADMRAALEIGDYDEYNRLAERWHEALKARGMETLFPA